MLKRSLVAAIIISSVLIVTALLVQRRHSGSDIRAIPIRGSVAKHETSVIEHVEPDHPPADNTPTGRIMEVAKASQSSAEMAGLLKKLYAENPDKLFEALMAIGNGTLETRRKALPLLAEALVLWPEAEGRYVFPVADAFAEMDLLAAAEWGAVFLVKTQRSDLAASSLLGRLVEISENRAFVLIASLPDDARKDAMNSVAYHLNIGDLNHVLQVCSTLDPQGASSFSRQLFERLGTERLDETAAWLTTTPAAARIPGIIASISQALVSNQGPRKAMAWADSLPDANGEAQAITTIYREWAKENPESAIQNILSAYDGVPELMADVFKGAAERHGAGAATQWDSARRLENASARSYAISALIEPMLVTIGPAEMKAKIATLPADSLERDAAELMLRAAYQNPSTVKLLENRFGKIN